MRANAIATSASATARRASARRCRRGTIPIGTGCRTSGTIRVATRQQLGRSQPALLFSTLLLLLAPRASLRRKSGSSDLTKLGFPASYNNMIPTSIRRFPYVTIAPEASCDKQANNRCGFIVGVGLTVQSAILFQGRIRPKNRAGSMDSKGNAEAAELHPPGRASPAGEACAGTLDTMGAL
jgi:hypothetical protein